MGRWYTIIPKGVMATLVIGAGIIFFLINSPPHTVCESQIDVFRENQKRFLFLDPTKKMEVHTKYQTMLKACQSMNNPGGCYELFQETKMMLHDLQAQPSECQRQIGEIEEVKATLEEVLELLVRLAWGEKPPATYNQRHGWLDVADISLYCKLQQAMKDIYGPKSFEDFRERMFHEMPEAGKMAWNDFWDLSLFSENCGRVP